MNKAYIGKVSLVLFTLTIVLMWNDAKQISTYQVESTVTEETLLQLEDYSVPSPGMLILDYDRLDYSEIKIAPSIIENEIVHIKANPIVEDGYLKGLNFFVFYETSGYVDAIYELAHRLDTDLIQMKLEGAYELTDTTPITMACHEARTETEDSLFSRCGWKVKSSIFSDPHKYVSIVQLYTVTPKTIMQQDIPQLLEKIEFRATGLY